MIVCTGGILKVEKQSSGNKLPILFKPIANVGFLLFIADGGLPGSDIRQGKGEDNPQNRKQADNVHGKGQACVISDGTKYCDPDGAHTNSKAQQQA